MRDYCKSIALLFALFAALAAGTFISSRGGQTYELARASAKSICGKTTLRGVTTVCRNLARLRVNRATQPSLRS